MRKAWIAGLFLAGAAFAQTFTTAAEIRPILQATKTSWVALREYDGADLLYFTHLESWRCGLSEVRYSINTVAADAVWELEPCHEDSAQPNAMTDENHRPYLTLPMGLVGSVAVVVTYDDGSQDKAQYERKAILMP